MGVVWKARQVSLNRLVVVKMILSGQFAGEAEIKRFRTEAEAAAQLQHPNIVAIHEIGEHEGRHFFSMDFVQGRNLAELVGVKALEPERAAQLVQSIAGAVQFAHARGVLHRDLKPQNVLIDAEGRPRVTDFGLAKLTHGASSLTVSGTAMGSPSYMPPEQAAGQNDRVGPASDVYSLGAILFELLTTRPPFLGATPLDIMKQVVEREPLPPRSLYPNVPADLDTICLKCLEKEPSLRYATAQELADDLGRFLRHEPIHARPSTRRERAVKWVRRNPRVAMMGGVVVAVAALGFAAVWWQLQQTRAALRRADQNAIAEATARAAAVPYRFIARHSNEVVAAVFSPDGRQVLSASHDGTAKLWDSFSGQPVATFTGHDGSLGPAQFSADGRRVLTFGGDTQNRFPHLTPDGRRMLHTSTLRYGDQTARLWDVRTGRQLLLLTNAADQLSSAALSPDGARVVTSSLDGAARIWDATDGRLLHTLTGHLASVRSAQFTPDGRRVVTTSFGTKYSYKFQRSAGSSSSGGTSTSLRDPFIAMFWDAGTGAAAGGVKNRARQPFLFFGSSDDSYWDSHCRAAFSPDGRLLVTASAALENLALWDAQSGRMKALLRGHSSEVNSAVFSPDGKRVLTASADHTARVWDARSGEPLALLAAHEGSVIDAVFSPDGKRIATASEDGTARIWDGTGRGLAVLRGHEGKVFTVRFSPDGARVVTAGADGTVRGWDAATPEQLAVPLEGHRGEVTFLHFSPDSRRVVTASDDKTARVWDTASGKLLTELKGLGAMKNQKVREVTLGGVSRAVFSPDGTQIATASDDQQVVVISRFTGMVNMNNWPPPGELLPFHPARIYDGTGRELLGVRGDGTGVDLIAFSPDGRKLLTASNARLRRAAVTSGGGTSSGSSGNATKGMTAQLWNAKTGELLATMEGHESKLYVATFSPDGQRLLTGDSKRMYLYDTATGKELTDFEKPSQASYGSFSPDGKRILGNQWGTATLWDATTGRQLLRIKTQEGQVGNALFSPDGKRIFLCGNYGALDICDATTGEPAGETFGTGKRAAPAAERSRDFAILQGQFSPDGRLVATLDAKGVVHLWDVTSRAPAAVLVATLRGHKAAVQHIAFSPDGRWLGTASKDYTAKLWPVFALSPGSPVAAGGEGGKE